MDKQQLIIIAVFVVLSILHSWWKKKQEAQDEQPPNPTPGPRPQRPAGGRPPSPTPSPSGPASWEEQLRRLLEGEPLVDPTPAPRRPPVMAEPTRMPVPPPVPQRVPVPAPVVQRVPAPLQGDPDMEVGLPVQMPTLAESAQAYLRGSHLGEKVAEHMRSVDGRVTSHSRAQPVRAAAPAIGVAWSLLRGRDSQRAAVVAGIILGPPKAAEDWAPAPAHPLSS